MLTCLISCRHLDQVQNELDFELADGDGENRRILALRTDNVNDESYQLVMARPAVLNDKERLNVFLNNG